MNIVKKFGILVSALLVVSGIEVSQAAPASANPELKIATVNVQQVLTQSPRVVALSKKLEDDFKNRQAKLGDQQKALQDELDKFKKESPTMSQKDKDTLQRKISADRSELVGKVVAYQKDLQTEQNKVMKSILDDLNGVVTKIAKNQSYALVLDSQAVIYSNNSTNITDDVAKQFNEGKS